MQESTESDSYQSSHCYTNDESFEKSVVKSSKDFRAKLKITVASETSVQSSTAGEETFEDQNQEPSQNEAEDEKGTQCADDEFSFECNGVLKSPISADDAFHNGQIKPFFPLFDQNLILADEAFERSVNRLPCRPPVEKIFVETNGPYLPPSSSKSENDNIDEEAAGPYCSWLNKTIEASQEMCKKSNSTGFSKIWRFRDFLNRSNSDGRDAFVFLNNSKAVTATGKKEEKVVEKSNGSSSSEKKKVAAPAMEVKVKLTAEKVKRKKGVKSEASSLSAHEKYMKNRASSEGDRRRSYLPYRPELVGFFTNVNGGLSRNVHPF